MAQENLFRGALGLNNVLELHRLKYREDGFCPLGEAVNCIIDDGGSVKRRLGISKVFEGATHSLWSRGKYCFFVSDGSLYRRVGTVNTLVTSGIGDLPMYYEVIFGKCYMTNGSVKLIVDDNSVTSWVGNLPTQVPSDTRVLGMLSGFTKLCVHAGRMFVLIDGKYLWSSEPGNPSCFNLGSGPLPFGEVHGMVSVGTGMYVSCEEGVVFLEGASKEDFTKKVVYSKKIVPETFQLLDGSDIEDGSEFYGTTAVWVSSDGVCFGDARGLVKNKTIKSLVFDTASVGACAVLPGQYFFSLEVS